MCSLLDKNTSFRMTRSIAFSCLIFAIKQYLLKTRAALAYNTSAETFYKIRIMHSGLKIIFKKLHKGHFQIQNSLASRTAIQLCIYFIYILVHYSVFPFQIQSKVKYLVYVNIESKKEFFCQKKRKKKKNPNTEMVITIFHTKSCKLNMAILHFWPYLKFFQSAGLNSNFTSKS